MADIHPGSFVGDSVEEWKKLPTWGKVAAGIVLVVVAVLAWRAKQAAQTAQQAAASTAGTTGSTNPNSGVAGTQSPFATVGGLPLLPSNVNPIFDQNGNPIAYQTGGTGTPPTQTGVNPPPSVGGDNGSNQVPNPGANPVMPDLNTTPGQVAVPADQQNAAITALYKQHGWQTFTSSSGGLGVKFIPGKSTNVTSADMAKALGETGGTTINGTTIYSSVPIHAAGGSGGPGGMSGFMENPFVYLASAIPHLPSSVPQK